ncbi:MAG: site-2 protease family protein [Lentisphaeria bacterium]|nr:site-2 protease family protein [Lentisphaeria bacterium]
MWDTVLAWGFNVLSVIFVIFAIGFCIFSHELGHFLAAKWRGLHVDAFAIGFRAFWKKKYKGVEYRIGIIPVGGYCEIPQIDATDAEPKAADGTVLPRAKPLDKIITAAAGPLFNIISGFLIACIVWAWGMPQNTPKMTEIAVLAVDENGPEYEAGLRKGDRIVKLNGETFDCSWEKFQEKLIYTNGEVELTVKRGGETKVIRYLQRINPDNAKLAGEGLPAPFFVPHIPVELDPVKGGAADKAGVKPGDRILEIDGKGGIGEHNFQTLLDSSHGKPLKFKLLRGNGIVEIEVVPHAVPNEKPYYLVGIDFSTRDLKAMEIIGTIENSAAEKAGIKPGDRIVELDGRKPEGFKEFREAIQKGAGKPVRLKLRRGAETVETELTPDRYEYMTVDAYVPCKDHPSPWSQFASTLNNSFKALSGIFITVGNKLKITKKDSQIKPRHLSGVLGMGAVLFKAAHYSFVSFVFLLVMISFALAIFNLLPLPVLDGGHILFGCVELVIRRPLPVKMIKVLYIVFAVLLILLMIYATFNDVRRIYDGSRKPAAAAKAKK